MSILLLLFSFVGIIVFLFFLWRGLREDYKVNEIFSFGFHVIIFMIIGLLVSLIFYKTAWFWLSYVGAIIGFVIGLNRAKIKFLDGLETAVLSFFYLFEVVLVGFFLNLYSPLSFAIMVFVLWLLLLFYFLKGKYKSFGWYKSGRIGFSSLAVLIIFFASRVPVAIFFPDMISFLGKFDAIPSLLVCLFFIFILIRLSKGL